MKAIYNTTGEIVDIEDMSIVTYKESDGTYVKTLIKNFTFIDAEKDYYTKLEHQAAIAAMQAYIIASHISQFSFHEGSMGDCKSMAHALVQELKEKEERK